MGALPPGSQTRRGIDRALSAQGIAPSVMLESGNPQVLAQMVGLGLGCSVLPVAVAERGHVRLRRRPGGAISTRSLLAVHRKSNADDPRVVRFLAMAQGARMNTAIRVAVICVALLSLGRPALAQSELSPSTSASSSNRPIWRHGVLAASYAGLYAGATKVGSRFGLEQRFRVVRLESAYAYDLVGHVYAVRELGLALGALNRWAGGSPEASSRLGAWGGAFGALTYMEVINGFMPGVRFDPLDPAANALGAWLATGASGLPERYPFLQRFSLQFGYKSWSRVFGAPQSSGFAGNVWHDYPNGRFALGYDVGPRTARWGTLHLTYEITSFELEELRNRFAFAVEFSPTMLAPWLGQSAWTRPLFAVYEWLDARLLMPGLMVEVTAWETGPFSDRAPFNE